MEQTPEQAAERTTAGTTDDPRARRRAGLLPEEVAAGSDDPQAQAEAVLAESDARTRDPDGTRAASVQSPD